MLSRQILKHVLITVCIILFSLQCRKYLGNGELPRYLWPLPNPSGYIVTSVRQCWNDTGSITFGEINLILSNALNACGYSTLRYFSIPNGYLISTGLERIEKNGRPAATERWSGKRLHFDPSKNFIENIISVLATENEFNYRNILFTITDTLLNFSDEIVVPTNDSSMCGAPSLPDNISKKTIGLTTDCGLLVYEFGFKKSKEQREQIIPGRIAVMDHLERTGLTKTLKEKILCLHPKN